MRNWMTSAFYIMRSCISQFNFTEASDDSISGIVDIVIDKKSFSPYQEWTLTFDSVSNNTGSLLIASAVDAVDFNNEWLPTKGAACSLDFVDIAGEAGASAVSSDSPYRCTWTVNTVTRKDGKHALFTFFVQDAASGAVKTAFSGTRRPRKAAATGFFGYGHMIGFGALMIIQVSGSSFGQHLFFCVLSFCRLS